MFKDRYSIFKMLNDYILYTCLSGSISMVIKILINPHEFTFQESIYYPIIGGVLGIVSPIILPILILKKE